MDAFLNFALKIQAYGDRQVTAQPRLKHVDWVRDGSGITVANPGGKSYEIAPGATTVIFDGSRATTIAVDTAFDIELSSLDPSRYRITWSGGTNPTLRTDRGLELTGRTLTFEVLANNSVEVTVSGAGTEDFTGVVAGDTVFIPNTTTGDDANVISVLNSGFWLVLGVNSATKLTLVREDDFEAVGESVDLTANAQFQAFSSSGVQVGDTVDISGGFALATRNTWEIVTVTSQFFEIVSTSALPAETGIMPDANMVFYTDTKSFLYIEADQLCAVRCNGSVDNTQKIQPTEAGNPERPGPYLKLGPTWSLSIVNLTPVTANVLVITAE